MESANESAPTTVAWPGAQIVLFSLLPFLPLSFFSLSRGVKNTRYSAAEETSSNNSVQTFAVLYGVHVVIVHLYANARLSQRIDFSNYFRFQTSECLLIIKQNMSQWEAQLPNTLKGHARNFFSFCISIKNDRACMCVFNKQFLARIWIYRNKCSFSDISSEYVLVEPTKCHSTFENAVSFKNCARSIIVEAENFRRYLLKLFSNDVMENSMSDTKIFFCVGGILVPESSERVAVCDKGSRKGSVCGVSSRIDALTSACAPNIEYISLNKTFLDKDHQITPALMYVCAFVLGNVPA